MEKTIERALREVTGATDVEKFAQMNETAYKIAVRVYEIAHFERKENEKEEKESDEQPMNEKIRQYFLQMVNAIRADDFELSGLNKEEVLAYLENQKEPKPTEWSEGDKKMVEDIIFAVREVWQEKDANRMIAKLKSLRPSLKPSEEQMWALYSASEMFGYMNIAKSLRELYAELKKL